MIEHFSHHIRKCDVARFTAVLVCWLLLILTRSNAEEPERGHSIGRISISGNLIVLQLSDGALGKANLFNLTEHTLRFAPAGSRYRVEVGALHWDPDIGPELRDFQASLHNFAFPFSGKSWNSFLVGQAGSIRFGVSKEKVGVDPYGHQDAGILLDRFDQLAEVAPTLNRSAPAICVFLKPRMSGTRHLKELPDRVVITWETNEPFGGVLDFSWFKTPNHFQAVLWRDGSIEMSYKDVTARDAIVGLFPALSNDAQPVSLHFSSVSNKDGPFAAPYEAFHYLAPPRPEDLSCTIIKALGDNFDFLAYYSDFRIDSQEASTPGDGPVGGNVSGIGDTKHDQNPKTLESHCTQGKFQQGFAQPVFVGSNEMQKGPPENAPGGGPREIGFYKKILAKKAPGGTPRPYNYAVGHLGHEIGHRWSAYAGARVHGEAIPLGPWPHWHTALNAPVAFPYSLPIEASTLGGSVWQDNGNGTFTQLRDGYFVPATTYSYLDLYLMGLVSVKEVPGFFILRDLVRTGAGADGQPIFKATRVNIEIEDVITENGPRLPDVSHSQKKFNTGIVVVVEHGKRPSSQLLEQANGIRREWINYWAIATGKRSLMTVNPH